MRFLLLVLGGWTGARAWWLWPIVPTLPVLIRTAGLTPAPPDQLATVQPMPCGVPALVRVRMPPAKLAALSKTAWPLSIRHGGAIDFAFANAPADPRGVALAQASMLSFGDPVPSHAQSRLSGSMWLLARAGPALSGGLAGAQLGGSQAGVRLAYAIDSARRLAIAGRLSTAIPASGSGRFLSDREGAIGLAWRPTRLPVTLVAEQRFVLDGGHGGPTVGVIAGLPPTRVAADFRLEAYGQAGVIARGGPQGTVEGFGDGAARLTRPVTLGPLKLDVGAGVWGGAQRGASRLDVGPTIGVAIPVIGHTLKLTADWRERIAGNARPGSGPALSLGTDF